MLLIPREALAGLVRDCFTGLGLSEADGSAMAEVLVDANLRGVESHGLQRVPTYMSRVNAGLAGGTDDMSVLSEFGPVRRVDAAHALGPMGATKATDMAVDLAREHGMGLVALGNSGHFGAAGFYARRAAGQDLLAIVISNGPKNMAPHGAAEPFLGTSALAIAAPLGSRGQFCLDMSASIVARGKVMRAHALGAALEPGLAIDAQGRPTTDPAAALAGSVLPLGGAKGTGLALAFNILAGMLAGSDFDDELAPMHGALDRRQNVGHVFIVIDPWRLADPQHTARRLEQLVDRLHALRTADGFEQVLYAGERGDALARERMASGIPVARAEIDAVARACRESGLVHLAERAEAIAAGAP